jgi:hypothetical protein
MSTNWFHDFFFGSNESAIEALDKLQKMDAEQFQKVFSALKEFQEAQKIDAEQFEKVFNALEEKIGTEQFQRMQGHLNSLQERLEGVEKKVETLTDTVAEQEKIMLTCCIVASVVAIAAISFIGFCIYQGIKSEREKQKGLSQNVPTGELIDLLEPDTKLLVDVNSTEKLPENTRLATVD